MSANDPKRTATILTVAGARSYHSTEPYDGAELGATSSRPGAYEAFALPSLHFGKSVEPRPSAQLDLVNAQRRIRAEARPYAMKAGSVPDQVAAHLRQAGGYLTFGQIAERFGLPATSVAATMKPAVTGGALVRLTILGRSALALPGFVPSAEDLVEQPNTIPREH